MSFLQCLTKLLLLFEYIYKSSHPIGKVFFVSYWFQIFWIFLLRGNAYSVGTFSMSSITDSMSAFFSFNCLFSLPNDPGLLISALGIPLLCTLFNSILPFQCHNSPQFSRSGCALGLMTCHDSAVHVAVPWFLILYFLVIYCLLFFFSLLLLSSKMILQTRLQSPDTSVVHTGRVILLAHWLEFVKIKSELPFWLPICLWSQDPSAVLCMKPRLWLNTS